jgi:hypothetical protein
MKNFKKVQQINCARKSASVYFLTRKSEILFFLHDRVRFFCFFLKRTPRKKFSAKQLHPTRKIFSKKKNALGAKHFQQKKPHPVRKVFSKKIFNFDNFLGQFFKTFRKTLAIFGHFVTQIGTSRQYIRGVYDACLKINKIYVALSRTDNHFSAPILGNSRLDKLIEVRKKKEMGRNFSF